MNQLFIQIDGQEKPIHPGFIPVTVLYELADCNGKRLFLNREDGIDIPLLPKEYLIIHGGEKFVIGESPIENNPPLRNEIQPEFNDSRIALPTAKITGKALKELDDKFPQGRLFADIEDGVDVEIADDITIVIQDEDSYFVIPPIVNGDDSIDIEECGKHDRRPPKGKKYRIRIDGDKYTVATEDITGTEILALAGKNFGEWSLNQKLNDGKREKIDSDEKVNLACPGIERFETVRRQAQQGAPYGLLPEDTEYLNGNYPFKWKKISEGNGKFGLLIEDFPIPNGYTIEKSTLMLLIPSGYPGSPLDMFYFAPPLNTTNGRTIGALVSETHFGQTWQRWSRHYQWRPGIDTLVTHIEYVKNEMKGAIG